MTTKDKFILVQCVVAVLLAGASMDRFLSTWKSKYLYLFWFFYGLSTLLVIVLDTGGLK